jgi:hypothetical protein
LSPGWFRTDLRLYVANRDRSKFVAAMTKQVDVLRNALGDNCAPVRAVLCFSRADWKPFAKPVEMHGVVVSRVQPLVRLIECAADRGVEVQETSELLARNLPPAT